MTEPPEIKVDLVAPPIPIRDFDWCAWRDGDEEEGPRGWGKSSAEAIADLLELEQLKRPVTTFKSVSYK